MGLYAQHPPNIVVFIADDAGMEYGCYGDTAAHTPNIDALASQGVRFTKAFLTSPQCSPSRTSMLSGQFAHTIGTEDLHTGIDSTTVLVPDYLKEAGYFSGLMLKGHIGKYGMAQFDWYDEGFWPDWVRDNTWHDKALGNFNTFLDQAGDRPFFLWVGFVDPHRPYRIEDGQGGRAPAVNEPGQVSVPPYLVDSPKDPGRPRRLLQRDFPNGRANRRHDGSAGITGAA
jgi:arylsulfatase A-like enzyme